MYSVLCIYAGCPCAIYVFFSKKKNILCILDKKDNKMMPSVVRCEPHANHFSLSFPKS